MTLHGKFEGKHSELAGRILGAFFQVHKDLGYGFSEAEFRRKVYDNERKGTLSWIKSYYFRQLGILR